MAEQAIGILKYQWASCLFLFATAIGTFGQSTIGSLLCVLLFLFPNSNFNHSFIILTDWQSPEGSSFEYAYIVHTQSWNTAKERCETRYNAELASVLSVEEHLFIFSLWNDRTVEVWIGGERDDSVPEGWRWVDGSPWQFELWMNGEPNNDRGNENCVRMGHPIIGFLGFWNDARCNQRR
eukprot:gene222-3601_t